MILKKGVKMDTKTKTITLRMPYNLHKDLKVKMAQEDKTMQNQILELVRAYLNDGKSKDKQ